MPHSTWPKVTGKLQLFVAPHSVILFLFFFLFFGLANIELVLNCLSSAGAWKANTVDGKLTFCSAGFGMFDLLIVVHRKLIDWIKWLQEQSPYLQLIRLISYFTFLSKFKQLLSC